MNISSLSGVTKAVVALGAGGVLAGAIALGASGGNGGGASPPAQGVAATATSVPEARTQVSSPREFVYSNYIPPATDVLQEVAQKRLTLDATGQRCPIGYQLYDSKLLGATFCYPPDWKVVRGDIVLPPANTRGEGYAYSILLTKADSNTKREVARVSIQVVGDRPFTLLDCPGKGSLPVDQIQATSCFHQRNEASSNSIPNGIARLIGFEALRPVGESKALWIGVQLADISSDYTSIRFSSKDQSEALEIVSSIRFNP
jgi:hypothetical protein